MEVLHHLQHCNSLKVLIIKESDITKVTESLSSLSFPNLFYVPLNSFNFGDLNSFMKYFPIRAQNDYLIVNSDFIDKNGAEGLIYDINRFSIDEPVRSHGHPPKRAI